MVVNTEEQFITIGLCALATMLTRFLPFLCFSPDKPTPPFVRYLGNALPAAVFGLLIVYCLKNVDFFRRQPRSAGNHRYRGDGRPSSLATANADVNRGGNALLHGISPVRIDVTIPPKFFRQKPGTGTFFPMPGSFFFFIRRHRPASPAVPIHEGGYLPRRSAVSPSSSAYHP